MRGINATIVVGAAWMVWFKLIHCFIGLNNGHMPAKIYDYFRSCKSILGLVDSVGETAAVFRGAGFNSIVDLEGSAQIAAALERFIPPVPKGGAYFASDEVIARTSRSHKAGQLASLFNEAVA